MPTLTPPKMVTGLQPFINRIDRIFKNTAHNTPTLTLDLDQYGVFVIRVASGTNVTNVAFTLPVSPPADRQLGGVLYLARTNIADTFNFGSTIRWPNSTPPTLTATNNRYDVFTFTIPQPSPLIALGFTSGQNFDITFT